MCNKIKCVICNEEFNVITWKHLVKHNLTLTEYKKLYPGVPIISSSALLKKKAAASCSNKDRKGIPRTQEVKDKISKIKKNNHNVAWNKGIPMSQNQKNKLSVIRKQQHSNGDILHWNLGNTTSNKTKLKISKTLKDQKLSMTEEALDKRKLTLKKKRNDGWVHHNTKIFTTLLKDSKVTNAIELYNNRDWLYEQHIVNKKTVASICVMLGIHWRKQQGTISKRLKKFDIPVMRWTGTNSAGQKEIEDFVEELNIGIIVNTRKIITPYELDIYIPEHKIAIEYNGLFWHSEAGKKNESYHLMKTEMCEKVGIHLIHIFEDEWRDQQQKCKDTIKHLLRKSEKGVYARNTIIKEIPWKTAKDFLNKYHLLNAGQPGSYRIGAFDKDDNLTGVMVFGSKNNENSLKNIIELKRFVTNKKNNPGLGSKMFKYAVKQQKYNEIIAFVDRRWFTGLVKSHIGFNVIGKTKPALWWTNGYDRHHRRFKTKQGLIKEGYDNSLSKREMLEQLGYIRIWDSGKFKLKWHI